MWMCWQIGRERGTQHISLVNFNPDSVSGKKRMGTQAIREFVSTRCLISVEM